MDPLRVWLGKIRTRQMLNIDLLPQGAMNENFLKLFVLLYYHHEDYRVRD
jgi:hypothetical protein